MSTHSSEVLSNLSISSNSTLSEEESLFRPDKPSILLEHQHIPVHISIRSQANHHNLKPHQDRLYRNNITIRRDNKLLEAMSLTVFSVYNMRSIWSKLSSLAEDMDNRDSDIAILSEVWEKKENVRHQNKIVELFELKDTKYFSTARPGVMRGGGAAITARGNKFYKSKLNIDIPKPLEVVWGLLKPKTILGGVSKIGICSFYCPPSSMKKTALIDHLTININKLKIIHPKAFFIIAGDKNDLN